MSNEEKANTWTHLVPLLATLALAYPLMALAYKSEIINHKFEIAGTSLFLFGMVLMFLS